MFFCRIIRISLVSCKFTPADIKVIRINLNVLSFYKYDISFELEQKYDLNYTINRFF